MIQCPIITEMIFLLFMFLVWISYSHQLGPDSSPKTQSPLSIVTAMVDRIGMFSALNCLSAALFVVT